ncbi:MAG: YfhO family protein [Chloroflexi bacterium]|nr:YfhO family protein [Chloroflexota bacterium]
MRAATLVDTRSGAFDMVPLGGWDKLLSSDIKLYRRQSGTVVWPFLARVDTVLPDSWDGSEAAIERMRDPAFDPLTAAVVHGAPDDLATPSADIPALSRVVSYTKAGTHSEATVVNTASVPLALVFNTAYFPGWQATLDGADTPLYRADIMFQAVIIPPGEHTVTVDYRPPWVRPLLAFAAFAWAAWILALFATVRLSRR